MAAIRDFAGEIALEAAELLRRYDNDFVTPMNSNTLRTLAADSAYQFAEARLGFLQQPVTRLPDARRPRGFRRWEPRCVLLF